MFKGADGNIPQGLRNTPQRVVTKDLNPTTNRQSQVANADLSKIVSVEIVSSDSSKTY